MFGLKKKKSISAKANASNQSESSHGTTPPSSAAYLVSSDKPPAQQETFYVNKTIPAVTYSTQYQVTKYAPERYVYEKPGKTVVTPVQNLVTVHPPDIQARPKEVQQTAAPMYPLPSRPMPQYALPSAPLPQHNAPSQPYNSQLALAAGPFHQNPLPYSGQQQLYKSVPNSPYQNPIEAMHMGHQGGHQGGPAVAYHVEPSYANFSKHPSKTHSYHMHHVGTGPTTVCGHHHSHHHSPQTAYGW